ARLCKEEYNWDYQFTEEARKLIVEDSKMDQFSIYFTRKRSIPYAMSSNGNISNIDGLILEASRFVELQSIDAGKCNMINYEFLGKLTLKIGKHLNVSSWTKNGEMAFMGFLGFAHQDASVELGNQVVADACEELFDYYQATKKKSDIGNVFKEIENIKEIRSFKKRAQRNQNYPRKDNRNKPQSSPDNVVQETLREVINTSQVDVEACSAVEKGSRIKRFEHQLNHFFW
ncbi:9542_t:CDS:2, partial [Acaulospora morrowiae]